MNVGDPPGQICQSFLRNAHLKLTILFPISVCVVRLRLISVRLFTIHMCDFYSSSLHLLAIMASQSKLRALLAMEEYNILLLSNTYKLLQMKKKKRKHHFLVHDILQKRNEHGVYYHLVRELELDEQRFH